MTDTEHSLQPSLDATSPDHLYRLTLNAPNDVAGLIELGIGSIDANFAIHKDMASMTTRFEEFFDKEVQAKDRCASLRQLLDEWTNEGKWELSIDILPNRNWQEAWKEHFHTERVSPRIVVKPSWEQFSAGDNDCVIEIDPGMSFGTGQHPTTRSCLRVIDNLADAQRPRSFLDLGCGSGILAIAAAKLGYTDITAIEMDPVAVQLARDNARSNGVIDIIDFQETDLSEFGPEVEFDVIAANLFAALLRKQVETISRFAAPSCDLVIAGLLNEQYPDVRDRYLKEGFVEQASSVEDEWTGGWFRIG